MKFPFPKLNKPLSAQKDPSAKQNLLPTASKVAFTLDPDERNLFTTDVKEFQLTAQDLLADELTWPQASSTSDVLLAQSGVSGMAASEVVSDAGVQLAMAPVAGTSAAASSSAVAATTSVAASTAAFPSMLLNAMAGLGVAGLAGAAGGSSGKSDKVAPGAPNIVRADDNVAPSLESVPNNGTTNDQTPSVVVTAASGSTVKIYRAVGADLVQIDGTTVEGPSGTYTFTPSSNLANGIYTLKATATDASGNVSAASTPFSLTVNTVVSSATVNAPVIENVVDDTAPVTGNVVSNGSTNDVSPQIYIRAEAGQIVKVYNGGTYLGDASAVSGQQGLYVYGLSAASGSAYNITAKAEASGVLSDASSAFAFSVSTVAPTAPTIANAVDDVSASVGNLSSGQLTNDLRPALVVNAQAGGTLKIYAQIGSGALNLVEGTTSVSGGVYTFVPRFNLADQTQYKFFATITNGAGESVQSSVFTLNTDGVAPSAPQITKVQDNHGNGSAGLVDIPDGGYSNDNTPVVLISAAAGSAVKVYKLNGGTLQEIPGSVTETTPGNFSFTPTTALTDGPYALKATATDLAGNVSDASVGHLVNVDTTILTPTLTIDNVTTDNIIKLSESTTGNYITGKVNNAFPGDSVSVSVGSQTYTGLVTALDTAEAGSTGQFSILVPVVSNQSPLAVLTQVSATVTATDVAGNTATSTVVTKNYTVDLNPASEPASAMFVTARGGQVWLDADQDGVFDAGSDVYYTVASGVLSVPTVTMGSNNVPVNGSTAVNFATETSPWTLKIWDVLSPKINLTGFDANDKLIVDLLTTRADLLGAYEAAGGLTVTALPALDNYHLNTTLGTVPVAMRVWVDTQDIRWEVWNSSTNTDTGIDSVTQPTDVTANLGVLVSNWGIATLEFIV